MKENCLVSLILLLTIIIAGCVSEAPGCNQLPFIMGGCWGKHLIKNLTVEPNISCLKIEPNNCNGGILEIINSCEENLTVEGLKIEKYPPLNSIDAIRLSTDEIIVNYSSGNHANYEPTFDDFITLNGIVGNNTIKISYIKTKSLC